jgi:hypothetical protein
MEYKIKFLSGLGIWAMTNDEVGVKYLGVLILVSQNTNGRDGRLSNSKPGCQTLKERRKRKKNHQFWNSRIASLVVVSPLVSSPVSLHLLGTLGALYWQPEQEMVEQLSGKPVELGLNLPQGRGSWQHGGCG